MYIPLNKATLQDALVAPVLRLICNRRKVGKFQQREPHPS